MVVGKGITNNTLYDLNDYLNRYVLHHIFDILNYNDISNENLKKHIYIWKIIYEKGN